MGARAPTPESKPNPIPLMHWEGEELVRKTGIPNTMIRPTIFAQHFTTMKPVYEKGSNVFYLPTSEGKVAWLDARDIGALAAHLLTLADPSAHYNQAYHLTGPKALTSAEIAEILSTVSGQTIKWNNSVEELAARQDKLMPDNKFGNKSVRTVYIDCKEGWLGKWIPEDFSKVMGRSTTPFIKFAYDNVANFSK